MKKKNLTTLLCAGMTALMLSGCGEQQAAAPAVGTEAAEPETPAEPETEAEPSLFGKIYHGQLHVPYQRGL